MSEQIPEKNTLTITNTSNNAEKNETTQDENETQETPIKENLTTFGELKLMTKLAIPICLGQLAGFSMTFVDTVMSGRAGAIHMAAVAVAGSIWVPILLFAQGLLMPIIPFVAQKNTAAKPEIRKEEAALYLRQGFWLSLLVGTFTCILVAFLATLGKEYSHLAPDAELFHIASDYLLIMSIGVFPFLLYLVQRFYLEGLGLTRPTMFIGFLALAVNIPLNYIFIFGKLGMPALGAVGCAIATVAVSFSMWLGMLYFVKRHYDKALKLEKPNLAVIKKIFVVALPNAVALLLEVSIFALVALLITPFGTHTVSGHQVALNVSSLFFMLPLSLATVASIRIGNMLGEKNLSGSITVRKSTSILSILIGLFNCFMIFTFKEEIACIYSTEQEVISLAASFMIYTAVFQLVDSIQISATGLLRGYNDTKALLILAIIAYWLIAFPLGYSLTFYGIPFITEPIGAYGFWLGMVVGLVFASIFFTARVFYLEKQPFDKIMASFSR